MAENTSDPFANAIVWGPNGREDTSSAVAEPPAASVAVPEPPEVPPADGEANLEEKDEETQEVVPQEEAESLEEPPAPEEPPQEEPEGRRRRNERFSELTHQRDFAREERDYWKQRFEEMAAQQRLAEQPPPQVPQDGLQRTPQGRPMRPAETAYATTQDYEQALMQYEDALLQWHGQQVISAYDQQRQAQDGLTRVREKYPDFDQVISTSRVSVNNDVGQAIQVSGMQHELLYHLATHPQAAQALAYMQGPAAYLAIGELRASLRQPAPPSAPPPSPEPPPRVTPPAPPPIAPTRAASARAVRNYDEMSWEEFEQVRNKEEQALRR